MRNIKNQTRIAKEVASKLDTSTDYSNNFLETEELEKIIERAIDKLPSQCKTIFTLSRKKEMTNREIANKLGISIKTVENQITIAIKKIKVILMPYYKQIFILFFLLISEISDKI